MRKLTYFVASTIDGVIAGPGGGDPSGPDGFFIMEGDHLQDLFTDWPDILPGPARAALGIDVPPKHFDTVLEGRASYQVGLDAGITDAYPHLEHYVFSRTMTEAPDPAVRLVSGDPVEKVRELKRRDGLGIWLVGGATLAGALRPEIDELVVKLHPVVAGAGIPLFSGEFGPQRFDLADVRRFDSGVLYLTYTKR
ncbi:dihydrofolate reductase family protein [Prauserella endophytica]|uniref:Dihydrofolate reductase n=1 Tax=Prauserella endophytica TaxID=1592324 RepID=A0ABY2S2R6_9PSEU|nr:dihydrofolate reductase family protein [Prauserella endophytica]TKG69750.1 dihydrofolate reductase [Prauserella endophytica]